MLAWHLHRHSHSSIEVFYPFPHRYYSIYAIYLRPLYALLLAEPSLLALGELVRRVLSLLYSLRQRTLAVQVAGKLPVPCALHTRQVGCDARSKQTLNLIHKAICDHAVYTAVNALIEPVAVGAQTDLQDRIRWRAPGALGGERLAGNDADL